MNSSHFDGLVRRLPSPANYHEGVTLHWPGFPQKVLIFSPQQAMAYHAFPAVHHRFLLILGIRGTAGVVIDGKIHSIRPGHGILVFPFQQHCYTPCSALKRLWLFVGFDFDDPEVLAPFRNRPFMLKPAHWSLTEKLTAAFHRSLGKPPPATPEVNLWLSLLLASLENSIREAGPLPVSSQPRLHRTVQELTQYVMRNIHQPLGISEIARGIGVSSSHLRRICSEFLGLSLGRFVRRIRVARACNLLCNTQETISRIGSSCGFTSVYSFSRTFKAEIGISPLRYRREASPENPSSPRKFWVFPAPRKRLAGC
jgi:AraC-like DNA-binding protein